MTSRFRRPLYCIVSLLNVLELYKIYTDAIILNEIDNPKEMI